jgi:hypothetical protein
MGRFYTSGDKEAKPVQHTNPSTPIISMKTRGFAEPQTAQTNQAQPQKEISYTPEAIAQRTQDFKDSMARISFEPRPQDDFMARKGKAIKAKLEAQKLQAKLAIGAVGDKYEQEADKVASQVVQTINTPKNIQREDEDKLQAKPLESIQREEALEEEDEELQMKPLSNSIQRDEALEEEEELQMKPMLQRREAIGGGDASEELESSIQQAKGSGQPLDPNLQEKMGQAMGADFSHVKVHTDSQSDQLNQSIQAKAFTTGQDVFFRQGAYNPSSADGQELIAHELTHVVQQNGGAVQRSHLSPKREQSIQTKVAPYALKVSDLHLTSQAVVTQRYFLGAATASSSPTVLSGQDRQADHSFRDPTDLTHTQIATSGRDPTAGLTPLKISEKGKMAIENVDDSRQAKVFFAEGSIISKSNKELTKRGSKYLLQVAQANAITVTDQKGKSHTLDQIEAVQNPDAKKASTPKKVAGKLATQQHGLNLGVEATCIAVAEAIMGKSYGVGAVSAKLLSVKMKKLGLLTATEQLSWGTAVADAMTKQGKRKHGVLNEATVAQAYGLFVNNNPVAALKLAKKLKVNEFADPEVGQSFISEAVGATGGGIVNWLQDPTGATTTELKTPDPTVRGGQRRTGWGNHAGAVVAESGGDKITLENYARSGEDLALKDNDKIFYFAMYGPASKPTQTWHSVWSQSPSAPIANAVTGVFG